MISKIRILYNQRQLLKDLVVRDLRGRYVGSVFGFYWSVINPLINLLVFTFVFSIILKVRFGQHGGTGSFALYLFCGILPWYAFNESVFRSTNIIIENANLIKKVVFPSKILPVYVAISSLINELIGLCILLVAIIIFKHFVSTLIFLLPLIMLLQFLFTIGLGWALASINVFFRDTIHLIGTILMIWMYVTPIFYPHSMVPERFRVFLTINPVFHIVRFYRDLLLDQRLPDFKGVVILTFMSLASFFIGYLLFSKTQHKFADLI